MPTRHMGYAELGRGLGDMVGMMMGGADRQTARGRLDAEKQLSELLLERAQTSKATAEANSLQQRAQNSAGGRQDFLFGQTGLLPDQLGQLRDYRQTGQFMQPADGPYLPGTYPQPMEPTSQMPEWYTPDVQNQYRQAMSALGMNAVATGDTNASQLSDALQNVVAVGDRRAIAGGQVDPSIVAAGYAATGGKPLYGQGTQGVMNQYTGQLTPTDKVNAETQAALGLAAQRSSMADYYGAKADGSVGGGAGGGLDGPDEMRLFRVLSSIYNEGMDANGNFILSKNMAPKVIGMTQRAAQLMAAGQAATISEAAALAASEFGVPIPDAGLAALDELRPYGPGGQPAPAGSGSSSISDIVSRHLR